MTHMPQLFGHRYLEHSQLQIPRALPPVAEALNANLAGAAAALRGPTVSDKEWKTLLGKLVGLLDQAFCFEQHLHGSLARSIDTAGPTGECP